jgi:hypothetical protein
MNLNLLNVILPFLLFELKYVLIALVFVVLIETFIVKHFFNQKFRYLFEVLFFANISTTLIGYFLQGILRLFLTFILNLHSNNPILIGISGNIGLKDKWTPGDNFPVLISMITSILICFFLSIYVEKKIVMNRFEGDVREANVAKGVMYANIVSYTLLLLWIYFNYRYM